MLDIKELKKVYKGKKVLVTGHTGFKGSYVVVLLKYLGAKVYGYSLRPVGQSLYDILSKDFKKSHIKNVGKTLVEDETFSDIRDDKKLYSFVKKVKPDYILHMAAQSLVLTSYEKPKYTYEVNVMGTVNLLEAIRNTYSKSKSIVSILNVTTDKVYENNDLSNYAFKESDKLCGYDPYANSKSCSELVTYSYKKSFFTDKNVYRVSTARAGNVIGGGDLNDNRIIPDTFRAIKNKKIMKVRNPLSVRPYQYVLEPLILYLNILAMQKRDKSFESNYNIGPDKKDCFETREIVSRFLNEWKTIDEYSVPKVQYGKANKKALHEATFLRLDNRYVKEKLNYKRIFSMNDTMKWTAKVYFDMLQKNNLFDSIYNMIDTL